MYDYDYIISGAGAAGLSLLMRMMQHRSFDDKKILVVDKSPKTTNDRTWCFWEKQEGLFEPIVCSKWKHVAFYSNYYSSVLDLSPYQYKMIRGINFYGYVKKSAEGRSNVEFKYGTIEIASSEIDHAFIMLDGKRYTARYVFNSVQFSKLHVPAGKYLLLQHFKGWLIETGQPVFDPAKATLMDFRVSQEKGTTFVYVLPISSNKALVEYTLFNKELLQPKEYDDALQSYVRMFLQVDDYTIVEEEFGVIPMTNINFSKANGRLINIGTAGGQTKASSGYTFQFIQKQTQQIVNDLLLHGEVKEHEHLLMRRFKLYDSTLLNILHNNKLGGDAIFADLFKKNPTERVLRFLDNESSFEDEFGIMTSVPPGIFMKAAFQEIFR